MEHLLEMGLALSQFFKFVELFVAKLCFVVAYLSHVALVVKHELFVGDFLLLTHDHVEIKGIFYTVVVIVLNNFLQSSGSVGLGNNATREKGRLLVLFLVMVVLVFLAPWVLVVVVLAWVVLLVYLNKFHVF